MAALKTTVIALLLLAVASAANASPNMSTISGTVYNADGSTCNSCLITFQPPNNSPQVITGNPAAIYIRPASTTTDSSGALTPINLVQGSSLVVTQSAPDGSYAGAVPVVVPYIQSASFVQLISQNVIQPGTTVVNGFAVGTATLTAAGSPYASAVTDFMLACDATAGDVTYDLPASTGGGRWLDIQKVDSSTNTCTLVAGGSDTISGAASLTLTAQYQGYMVDDMQLGAWQTITSSLGNALPCINGAACGQINVAAYGTVGQNSWGMEAVAVTTNGTTTVTCTTNCGHVKAGQYIAIEKARAATAMATPSPVATPVTMSPGTYTTPPNASQAMALAAGCTLFNATGCKGTSGDSVFACQSFPPYEAGNSITVDGHTYTVSGTSLGSSNIGITGTLATTFDNASVTGANCSTTRNYKVWAVDAFGGLSPMGSASSTASANQENLYNMDQVHVTPDANAVAYLFASAEGAGSYSLVGLEDTDTKVYNPQTSTGTSRYANDPWALTSVPQGIAKHAPTDVVFHNTGYYALYPHNLPDGAAVPPDGGEAGWFLAQVVSVSGTTITLNAAVPLSVTTTLYHDDGPPINAAIVAAEVTGFAIGTPFADVYMPPGVYPIATTVTTTANFVDFHLHGAGGKGESGAGNGQSGTTTLVNLVLGNEALNVVGPNPYPELDHFMIADDNGSTARVALNIDSPNIAAAPTGQGWVHDMALCGANTNLRLANVNTQNVEFTAFDRINNCNEVSGSNVGEPEYGFNILSGNSLSHTIHETHLTAEWATAGVGSYEWSQGSTFVTSGGFLLAPFNSTNSTYDYGRYEWTTRFLVGLVNGGGLASQGLTVTRNLFTANMYYPDCSFFSLTAGGPDKFSANTLYSPVGLRENNTVCSNGVFTATDSHINIDSDGNIYDNISTPFTAAQNVITASNISTKSDMYLVTGLPTAIPVSNVAPTSQTIQAPCPFTMLQAQGTTMKTACVGLGYGFHDFFPYQAGTADLHGTLTVNLNGQVICSWKIRSANDMSSGGANIMNQFSPEVPASWQCSSSCGNVGTFNVCFSNTNGIEVENFSSNQTVNFLLTETNGLP